jgi:uncharacterized protein (TIGR03435 family)
MLRALLEDRFHLQAHRETIETDTFVLVLGRNGSKLKEYRPGDSLKISNFSDGARAITTAGPMEQFARLLEPMVGRAVVDRTALTGTFRVVLAYTLPGDPEVAGDRAPDVFTAVQDQLGLKLEPQEDPVEFLKIDRADKVPTEN